MKEEERKKMKATLEDSRKELFSKKDGQRGSETQPIKKKVTRET